MAVEGVSGNSPPILLRILLRAQLLHFLLIFQRLEKGEEKNLFRRIRNLWVRRVSNHLKGVRKVIATVLQNDYLVLLWIFFGILLRAHLLIPYTPTIFHKLGSASCCCSPLEGERILET